jgi:hypothetical protein
MACGTPVAFGSAPSKTSRAARARPGVYRLEQLPDEAVGETPFECQATRGQRAHALRVGFRARGAEHGGPADSRGSLHEDQSPVSPGCRRDSGRHRRKLGATVKN